jgi:hypothetical protein
MNYKEAMDKLDAKLKEIRAIKGKMPVEGNEDYRKLFKDTISNSSNLCEFFAFDEFDGLIIAIMVKPGRESLFTIFDEDRLQHLYESLKELKRRRIF